MRKTLAFVLLALLLIGSVYAQVNIQVGQTVTQNFDAIGTSATATLPAGWKADKNTTARLVGSYASAVTATERNGGNSLSTTASNGIYNFGAGVAAEATDRAIGFLSSSSATKSGNVYVQLANNGASEITSLTISYNVEKYRMGLNAAGFAIQMYYSTDGSTWTSAGESFLTTIAADATNDGYAAAPGATVNVSGTLNQSIAASGSLYLAWNYAVASGSTTSNAQALSVDDVSILANGGAPTPTINVSGTLNAFSTYTGTPSASQSYTLSGTALTGNINIAALTGYAYSTDNSNWSSTLSLANTYSGPVYVRLTGASAGSFSGDIVHSSTGASSVNVAASGTVTNPTPTITLSAAALNSFSTIVGTPSAAQSYTVEGIFLTANISIAAVSGYEYSTAVGGPYTSTLSLTPVSGTVAPTTVWVRLTGAALGEYAGNIAHSSTGAVTQDKAVTGTVSEPASPTTLFEENFDYTAATLLTANGWSAHSGGGTNSFFVSSPGLSYPGYPANSGLTAQTNGTSGEDVNRTFPAQTSGDIYTALLVKLSDAPLGTNGGYFFHLGTNTFSTSDFKGRIFAHMDTNDMIRFGVSRAGDQTTAVWTDYVYPLETTHLLVLKYSIVSGAANDVVTLWVNPTIGATEPAAQLTAADASGTDIANVGAVAFRQGNASNPTPVGKYDSVKVTNNWAQLWQAPAQPVIIVDTPELDPLACIVNIPSEEIRSYNLSGENLTSQLVVTAPNGFQIATSASGDWESVLTLPSSFDGTIYVRMFADGVGEYAGNITHTSGSATQVNVYVTGESFNPDVVWNITQNLVPFSGQAGTPTSAQTYSLSATGATTSLIVTTTAPFQLSENGSTGWTTELSLSSGFNGSVYVRMNAASAGDYNANIEHNTTNASPSSFAISGTASPSAGMAWDLFFSEYLEGSGNNKAIEIFNGTGAPVDLSDYRFENWFNGGSSPSYVTMTGTLAHGSVWVIANPSSTQAILDLANQTSGNISFNGDDALVLRKLSTNTIVDIFGVIGQDPGTQWTADGGYTTLDKTLVRKPTVVRGVTENPAISTPAVTTDFVTLSTEWDMYDVNYIGNLGLHTFGTVVSLDAPVVVISENAGNVVLTWAAVTGAASYRIEASDDPYTGYSPVTTTANLTWSGAASTAKKFYRVIALP